MSMWSVPDKETQGLMTMFYAKWLSGKSKHEALHEAQLELRKEIIAKWGDDRPYYWAAYGPSRPKTATVEPVPKYTLPLTTSGVMKWPATGEKWSRFPAAWFES
jgi:hypothetical protein